MPLVRALGPSLLRSDRSNSIVFDQRYARVAAHSNQSVIGELGGESTDSGIHMERREIEPGRELGGFRDWVYARLVLNDEGRRAGI